MPDGLQWPVVTVDALYRVLDDEKKKLKCAR